MLLGFRLLAGQREIQPAGGPFLGQVGQAELYLVRAAAVEEDVGLELPAQGFLLPLLQRRPGLLQAVHPDVNRGRLVQPRVGRVQPYHPAADRHPATRQRLIKKQFLVGPPHGLDGHAHRPNLVHAVDHDPYRDLVVTDGDRGATVSPPSLTAARLRELTPGRRSIVRTASSPLGLLSQAAGGDLVQDLGAARTTALQIRGRAVAETDLVLRVGDGLLALGLDNTISGGGGGLPL